MAVRNDCVVLSVQALAGEQRERLKTPRLVAAFRHGLSKVMGQGAWTLEFVDHAPGSEPPRPPEPEPPEPAPEPSEALAPAKKEAPGPVRRTKQEWLRDPTIRTALEVFNGEISEIRE